MERIFHLLLVDDEPHVTDALSSQLEDRHDLDVYVSNSAEEALCILHKTRIDLIISDIRMPGMNGLELLGLIKKEQPDCRVILLTGYADFNYVYEAIKQGASGYVLKNESDDVLMEQLDKSLSALQKETQMQHLLDVLLTEKEQKSPSIIPLQNAYSLPKPKNGQSGTLLYLTSVHETSSGLFELIPHFFHEGLDCWHIIQAESGSLFFRLIWKQEKTLSWISSVLEHLQDELEKSYGQSLSIFLSALPDEPQALPEILHKMEEACALLRMNSAEGTFVYTVSQQTEQNMNPCKQLQTYIRSHLNGDLSLTELGNISGYNGDYLNRIFRQETGQPIGRYIAICKLEKLQHLLQNPNITIERAASEIGFTSRSYFNRFVRRETGMSPNAFRELLLKE